MRTLAIATELIAKMSSVKALDKSAYVPQPGPILHTTNVHGVEQDHFLTPYFLLHSNQVNSPVWPGPSISRRGPYRSGSALTWPAFCPEASYSTSSPQRGISSLRPCSLMGYGRHEQNTAGHTPAGVRLRVASKIDGPVDPDVRDLHADLLVEAQRAGA